MLELSDVYPDMVLNHDFALSSFTCTNSSSMKYNTLTTNTAYTNT